MPKSLQELKSTALRGLLDKGLSYIKDDWDILNLDSLPNPYNTECISFEDDYYNSYANTILQRKLFCRLEIWFTE